MCLTLTPRQRSQFRMGEALALAWMLVDEEGLEIRQFLLFTIKKNAPKIHFGLKLTIKNTFLGIDIFWEASKLLVSSGG